MTWMRRRWWIVPAALIVVAYFAWFAASSVEEARDRRQSRTNIENIANDIKDQGERVEALAKQIKAQGERIEGATSDEAKAASDARLAAAIADIRRSIDCAELDDEATYAACAAVAARMDAIRAGADPFARTGGS